jgi:type IV secretion system protein VirB6
VSAACVTALDAGVIRGVLSAVDCRTREFAGVGYASLTGAPVFQAALTIILTLYVAAIGYRLLFAAEGARLSDAPGVALRVGLVLTLVTSWSAFQTLVFDVAGRAPLEIAGAAAAPLQAGDAQLARDPVDGLQTVYDQLNAAAAAFGKVAPAVARPYASGQAAAGEALSQAAGGLFASTAGVIAVASIALGVLAAVGPLFITLVLFRQTRGLFEGWVRAICAAAFVPMGAWIVVVLMLAVVEPWLAALDAERAAGQLDVQGGMTVAAIVFVFCAAQAALVAAACLVAGGFRWRRAARTASPQAPPVATSETPSSGLEFVSRAQRTALAVRQLESAAAGESRRTLVLRDSLATPRPETALPGERPSNALRRPAAAPRRRLGSQ